MSKILDQDHQLYFKFQKIFNMFDIYLKRELVSDFLNNSNNVCFSRCFDDERKNFRLANPNFSNASEITLNHYFYNCIYDDELKFFMQKIVDTYYCLI